MSENSEQNKPLNIIPRKVVEFGSPDEPEGLAWGVEVDFDIDPLVTRSFSEHLIKIPKNIKRITYLDLCPQEELPLPMRTIRSDIRPSHSYLKRVTAPTSDRPHLKKLRRIMNLMMPQDERRFALLADMVLQATNKGEPLNRFNQVLSEATGDCVVIVHGHSFDLGGSSSLGEQYPDEVKDDRGRIIQRKYNAVSVKEILKRYDDPNKFAVIVLNGCNPKGIGPEASKVPVFYPRDYAGGARAGYIWSRKGGFSIPGEFPS